MNDINSFWGTAALFILGLVFNAGGFIWMTKTHFNNIHARLDRLDLHLDKIDATNLTILSDVAYLKGAASTVKNP